MFETISRKIDQILTRVFGQSFGMTSSKSLKSGKSHRVANILLVILLAISGLATFNGVSAFYGLEDLSGFSFQSNYSLLIVLVFTVLMWYTIDYAVTRGNSLLNRLGFWLCTSCWPCYRLVLAMVCGGTLFLHRIRPQKVLMSG